MKGVNFVALKNQMHVHIPKELREKLNIKKRSLLVKKGDTVKIMRGKFKGKVGKVVRVDYKKQRVYIEGVTVKNAKNQDKFVPIHPSNLCFVEIVMDKDREKMVR